MTATSPRPITEILADSRLLRETGIRILAEDKETGVAFARVTPRDQNRISAKAHEWGRCGGYEALPRQNRRDLVGTFKQLRLQSRKNMAFDLAHVRGLTRLRKRSSIEAAVAEVDEKNIEGSVKWLSSFHTRYNRGPNPNEHVVAMKDRLEKMVAGAKFPVKVDLIDHTSTAQKSVRVHLEGAARPNEIVVLGGHLDSINQSVFGDKRSPGADDNASGSSDLIEALRIAVAQAQPQRSIEFFWYAGEESGLLGSAEIARSYKDDNRDVIGVLQLDMTMFPGSGEFTLGSMTDFTSAWLRSYFANLNDLYIKAKIVDDRCGYGCSDHASWHRQGYPALMPFESSFDDSNPLIHSRDDAINGETSFRHSAMFAKIAVAFALDLSNSTLRSP